MQKIKRVIILSLFLLPIGLHAQVSNADSSATPNNYLRVFLEGIPDWEDYIKVNLWFVDYVRDPKEAQVHVIISLQATASGGSLYHLFFLGRENFKGKNDTLTYTALEENTNRKTRDEITTVLTSGLASYISANGQRKYLAYNYGVSQAEVQQSFDKWNNWVFTVQGNFDLAADQNQTIYNGFGSLSASKITDDWKLSLVTDATVNNNSFATDTINYTSNTIIKNLNGFIVKSINDHWSVGLQPAYYSSNYSNIKTQLSLAAGVEYNIFPYSQSVNHFFTFRYRLQPLYNFYIDSTIFNVTQEFLMNHVLDATFTRISNWGNFSITATASQYLNHPQEYRLDGEAQIDFHIAKGLFLNLIGNASLINNQRSVSKAILTPQEVLLQQREILTTYSTGFSIGITYTFGSIFNNIVNPRYETGVNISNEIQNPKGEGAD
ncbi:MAG: hypothetical protein LH473_11195 [Chitinophagales bacterium]|nr:hypothetical protein [Chitinophagales bacterium]